MIATHFRHLRRLVRSLLGLLWLCAAFSLSGVVHSNSNVVNDNDIHLERLNRALECAKSNVRLERLECYDDLFHESSTNDDTTESKRSRLWQSVERLEAGRETSQMGLLVKQSGDTVLMSVPALGIVPPRPVLVISCAANITRFQLHLPQPSHAAQVALTLQGQSVRTTQNWRVLDDGYVLSGGRGLPAIGTLKQILNSDRLELASEMSVINGLSFDVEGLREKIQPLREMCRW